MWTRTTSWLRSWSEEPVVRLRHVPGRAASQRRIHPGFRQPAPHRAPSQEQDHRPRLGAGGNLASALALTAPTRQWWGAAVVASLGLMACGGSGGPSLTPGTSPSATVASTPLDTAPAAYCRALDELSSNISKIGGTSTAPAAEQATSTTALKAAASDFQAAAAAAGNVDEADLFKKLSAAVTQLLTDVNDLQASTLDADAIGAALSRGPRCSESIGTPIPASPTAVQTASAGCTLSPEPTLLVWYRSPGVSDSAQELGSADLANCQPTLTLLQNTSPKGAGYCTEVALSSDNPGYDVNADPAPRPKKVIAAIGGSC